MKRWLGLMLTRLRSRGEECLAWIFASSSMISLAITLRLGADGRSRLRDSMLRGIVMTIET